MKIYKTKILVLILMLETVQFGCKSFKQNEGLPSCIASKIEDIKNEPIRNPPAEVWKWEADGNTYFYFNSPCCDQFNYLYNNKCDTICAPDGGFTGKGDQNCPDFGKDLKKTLIWKDERK